MHKLFSGVASDTLLQQFCAARQIHDCCWGGGISTDAVLCASVGFDARACVWVCFSPPLIPSTRRAIYPCVMVTCYTESNKRVHEQATHALPIFRGSCHDTRRQCRRLATVHRGQNPASSGKCVLWQGSANTARRRWGWGWDGRSLIALLRPFAGRRQPSLIPRVRGPAVSSRIHG